MKIAVIGGGPGGLFFARLARLFDQSIDIDIFEQNPPNATFGFGVVLAGQAQDRLQAADPELHQQLARHMVSISEQDMVLETERLNVKFTGEGGAIERLKLLEVQERLCRAVGLEITHSRRIETRGDLAGYDLVIGADGANSIVRRLWQDEFRPRERLLGNRFAWYGVDRALDPSSLVFRNTEHGCFIAHYYPYTEHRSTFVAECDAITWSDAGLDRLSDDDRKALFERVFEAELDGGKLLDNKSVWRQFNAITVDRWYAGNAVLLGDALRVAHYSIGSGTRLAMEDANDLFEALKEHGEDVPALLESYVARRKKTRDLFTAATVASFEWYEDIRQHMKADVMDFVYGFMTRTGRVDDKRLKLYAPLFHDQYMAYVAGKRSA